MENQSIPILDLTPEFDQLGPEILQAIERVMRSGQFILGPEGRAFEEEVAAYVGSKHAIGLNSGTDALIIALRALGVGPGAEVITTPFSFFATAEAISLVGATPVFVDIDLDSMNIDPARIETAITDRTRAIIPVHLFGNPCKMTRIMEIANRHGIPVVEDCAQSFGSRYETPCQGCEGGCGGMSGKSLGTFGMWGTISFFPTKNLGAYGDAGMLITDNDEQAELARKLRTHGSIKRYENEMLGYNSRLDSVQAAVLRIKLKHLDDYTAARRKVAKRYSELFSGVDEIVTPMISPGHVFHQYTIRVLKGQRDKVQSELAAQGISTVVYYPIPQHLLPVYRGQFPSYPISEGLAPEVLSLPIWPQITDEQQRRVAEAVKEIVR